MIDRIPTAAIVRPEGPPRSLVSTSEPNEEVTERQLGEPGYTVRLLMRILREIAALRRRYAPGRIDFEDVVLTSGTYTRLSHNFGGRVRWWVTDIYVTVPIVVRSNIEETDQNTLVLYSGATCVCTIRVEEAG